MKRQIPPKVRAALHERAGSCCEICGLPADNAHHRRNQSQGGLDVLSNLMLLCGSGTTGCHGTVTTNPKWAEEHGYTIKGTEAVPAEVPVLFWFGAAGREPMWVLLDDEFCVHPTVDPAVIAAVQVLQEHGIDGARYEELQSLKRSTQ